MFFSHVLVLVIGEEWKVEWTKLFLSTGLQCLPKPKMLLLEIRSEKVFVPLKAILLSLCLHFLHENQGNNRMKSMGGMEE